MGAPAQVTSLPERHLQTLCLLILTVIVCGMVLHELEIVFLPLVLAIFISVGLSAFVSWQVRRLRFPIPLAVLMTLVLTWIALSLVGFLMVASVDQMIASSAAYEQQLHALLTKSWHLLPLRQLGLPPDAIETTVQRFPIQSFIVNVGSSVLNVVSVSVMVLLYVVYLLFVLAQHTRRVGIWQEIEVRVRSYVLAKTAISAATGVMIGLVLYVCGIQFSGLFGALSAVLNFIPFVGPLVASLAPWPVILLSPDMHSIVLVVALLFPGTLFFVVGNFIEPSVLGRSVQLHPLTVLLALVFWGVLWGPLGVLLATPITSVLVVLLGHLPITRPIANLFAGRDKGQVPMS